jgi:hypothetical protein
MPALFWPIGLVIVGILFGFFIEIVAYIAPFIRIICFTVFVLSLLSLPAAILKKYRRYAGWGLISASFALGLEAWIDCFVSSYQHMGKVAVFVGSLFFGVGVVPLGIFAAAFKGMWFEALILAIVPIIAVFIGILGYKWADETEDPIVNVDNPIVFQNEEYDNINDMPEPKGVPLLDTSKLRDLSALKLE